MFITRSFDQIYIFPDTTDLAAVEMRRRVMRGGLIASSDCWFVSVVAAARRKLSSGDCSVPCAEATFHTVALLSPPLSDQH